MKILLLFESRRSASSRSRLANSYSKFECSLAALFKVLMLLVMMSKISSLIGDMIALLCFYSSNLVALLISEMHL